MNTNFKSSPSSNDLNNYSNSHNSSNNSNSNTLNAILSPIKLNNNNNNNINNSNNNIINNISLTSSKSYNSLMSLESLNNSSNNVSNQQPQNNELIKNQNLISLIPNYQIKKYELQVKELFEKNSPENMKSIEYKKRAEIEDMKSQLRNLIGNKYRDLVEGSDAIVKMKKSTELISENLVQMQLELKQFSDKRNYRKGILQDNSKQTKEKEIQKKISIFSKYCKYLIDIPEVIWRSLDSNDYFEVSVHFLKSKYLYYKITNETNPEIKKLLSKLLIIDKQWLLMKQFPIKTINYSKSFLLESSRQFQTPIEKYIGSLSTLVLFDKKSIKDTFKEFLLSRKVILLNYILNINSGSSSSGGGINQINNQSIQNIIEKMIQFIKNTVYYILLLFYPRKELIGFSGDEIEEDENNLVSSQYQSKLSKFKSNLDKYKKVNTTESLTVNEEKEEEKEIKFTDNELNQLPNLNFTSPTLEATFTWRSPYLRDCLKYYKQVSNGTSEQNDSSGSNSVNNNNNNNDNLNLTEEIDHSLIEFENFNSNFILNRTSEWLEDILLDFKNSSQVYFSKINNLKDLSNLRLDILNIILNFLTPIQNNSNSNNNNNQNNNNTNSLNWNRIFKIISGKDIKYFLNIFNEIFLIKIESVIENSFKVINLSNIQVELFNQIKSEDKNFSEFLWFSNQDDPVQSIKNKTSGITPLNSLFLFKINQQYNQLKSDLKILFNNNSNSGIKEEQKDQDQISSYFKINENLIKEYMKKYFLVSITQFSQITEDRINNLYNQLNIIKQQHQHQQQQQQQQSLNQTKIIDEILFISKILKIFYKNIISNPNLYFLNLNNIFDTASNNSGSGNSSGGINLIQITSPKQQQDEKQQQIQQQIQNIDLLDIEKLKQLFYYCCIIWINQFILKYSDSLNLEILNQNWNDSNRIKTWEKHIIQAVENDSTSSDQSTTIYIPYQVSSFISKYLISVSLELSKFSLNTIDKNILKYTLEILILNLFKIYNNLLNQPQQQQQSSHQFNKEGYIQLLIDIKYLGLILFGRDLIISKKYQQQQQQQQQQFNQFIIKDQNFKKSKNIYQQQEQQNNNNNSQQQQQQNSLNLFNQLIELVESKLDPIDLMFYNPYINKFLESVYSKTFTLFGNFIYLHKTIPKPIEKKKIESPSSDISSPPLVSDIPNSMQLLKTSTKFQLFSSDTIQSITDSIANQQQQQIQQNQLQQQQQQNISSTNSNLLSPPIPIKQNQQQNQQQNSFLSSSPSSTINTFSFMGKKISDLMYKK